MFKLHTLGAIELLSPNGQTLRSVLAQRKRLALLVYLAVNQDVGLQRRDHLVALLWPELDDERARHALRQTLYYLRSQLGPDVIVSHGDAEVGVGGLWCDVPALRQATEEGRPAEAVTLRRGQFLEGFHVDGISQDFEMWISEIRREVTERTSAAAWQMVERCERAGSGAEAAEWARRAVRLNPLEDSTVQRLMKVLDRQGDRAAAVVAYEDFAERLRAEYDLAPAPETRALLESLRDRAHARGVAVNAAEPDSAPVGIDLAPRRRATPRAAAAAAAGESALALPEAAPEVPAAAPEALAAAPDAGTPGADEAAGWRRPRLRRLRLLAQSMVLLAIGASAGPLLVRWTMAGGAPDAGHRVLVLPFTVRGGPDQQFLAEGLVDLLSSGLDGAGDLVSVPAPAVLSYLHRIGSTPSTPGERSSLARRFHAGFVVGGDVVAVGDRLRVTAWVFRADQAGTPLVRADAEGSRDEALALADRLVMELAAGPENSPGSHLARIASANTSSLPAMKAYLDGEQKLRRGEVAAAIDAFQVAVREDSTFALAYYGLSVAASAAFQASIADDAAARAARHMDRLPERERDLLLARIAYRIGDAATAERITRELVFHHPNDAEVWAQLGEALFHLNPLRGRPIAEARDAFEHVRELDPGASEATYHLAQLAAMRGDLRAAAKLAEGALALNPAAHRAPQLRLIRRAAGWGGAVDSAFLASDLHGQDDLTIVSSAYTLGVFLHDPVGAERALALLDREADSPAMRAFEQILRAQLEMARGRWRSARVLLDQAARAEPARAEQYRALLALVPWFGGGSDEVAAVRDRLAAAGPQLSAGAPVGGWSWADVDARISSLTEPYLEGGLAARAGDGAAVALALDTLEARSRVPTPTTPYAGLIGTAPVTAALDAATTHPRRPELGGVYGNLLRGAARGRTATVDPVPSGFPDVSPEEAVLSPFFSLPAARYAHAIALRSAGDLEGAASWFASLGELSIPDLVYLAPAHLRLADLDLRRGRRAAAAEHYRAFLALWHDCDPEHRPIVDAVARKLQTLAAR